MIYAVIQETSLEALVQAVNEELQNGWQVQGSIIIFHDATRFYFVQPMCIERAVEKCAPTHNDQAHPPPEA